MTEEEKLFFIEYLSNPLVDANLLHLLIPKYSITEYKDLQKVNDHIIHNRFRWNAIKNLIDTTTNKLDYSFSEVLSCLNINRYLMIEQMQLKRLRYERIRKRKPISKRAFRLLLEWNKKMESKSRK